MERIVNKVFFVQEDFNRADGVIPKRLKTKLNILYMLSSFSIFSVLMAAISPPSKIPHALNIIKGMFFITLMPLSYTLYEINQHIPESFVETNEDQYKKMNDLLLARDIPMLPSFFDEKKEEKLKDEN